ncbi:phosphate ABC transporter substrate-binding protein PstS [Sphingomonas sp. ID1715]|uniref:phosphate ABC transporter substrate-binding protein PstS n=1 Tax=Sphingomonas sp. ID1715 TaxID=1656898 RepID=UPI00148763A7|nr:phosphate ABC transporter substrate-binding protein PstS [Sphingomonas sp. ID1715]NNM75944.1 phosphate ABC transporter substrate-binding protein PstS [Sphingomonas sp. ID1715]
MFRALCLAAVLAVLGGCGGSGDRARYISGAGATFPASLYAKWSEGYRGETKIGLNYQAIGSGGGIKQIKARTVDFGATDKPLTAEQLDRAGLYQFPTVIGGVVPILNVDGITPGQLKLTGPLLAAIFLGDVKSWNDPRIASLNPGAKLPAQAITVVHRSDGSGTTFLFTSYLSGISPAWKQRVGASDAVSWPTGLAGKGNDGVAAFVKQTAGSIGYVEYAYAKQNNGAYAQLQNRAGQFVVPSAESFGAAAASADWAKAPGNYLVLVDQPGGGSWPITGASFILVYREQTNAQVGRGVLRFFDWGFAKGDQAAAQLDYVPLPATVKDMIRKQWAATLKAEGKPLYPLQ